MARPEMSKLLKYGGWSDLDFMKLNAWWMLGGSPRLGRGVLESEYVWKIRARRRARLSPMLRLLILTLRILRWR